MIVKLLPKQIPFFWDAIKFSAVRSDEVKGEAVQPYLTELLHALLSDKAQCFVRLDEKRTLLGILITRVVVNKITGAKYLLLQNLFSWLQQDDDVWISDYMYVKKFAESEECRYISLSTGNPVIFELANRLGFKEQSRTYTVKM